MKIYISKEKTEEIKSFKDWERFFKKVDSDGKTHWKEGRSASSLAKFIMDNENSGENDLISFLSPISEDIHLDYAIPEYEVKFDNYSGNGRKHDLGIFGTADGKPLFVGIEAKVDEEFGPTIAKQFIKAMAKRWNGKATNAPERVGNLIKRFFPTEIKEKHANLRYQLFTAIAGTLDVEKDLGGNKICHRVFLVIEFDTGSKNFDKKKAESNHKDYDDFIKAIKEEWKENDNTSIFIDGKRIDCIYKTIKL